MSLGLRLIKSGLLAPWQLFHARERLPLWDATLMEILAARGWLSPEARRDLLSRQLDMQAVDLSDTPPDPNLAHLLPATFCQRHNVIPWRSLGGLLILATGAPERLSAALALLPEAQSAPLKGALIAVATPDQVETAILDTHRPTLTQQAETRTAPAYSCRNWHHSRQRSRIIWAILILLSCLILLAPSAVFSALTVFAALSLVAVSGMKIAAFMACAPPRPAPPLQGPLPRISVMVPLFREKEVAQVLVNRLSRLTYPEALLDVLLVLEAHDDTTQAALKHTTLPRWMRVITVPAGSGLTTKPRALNYALDFCKGDIIGIWDAEDAPAPDQLETVANHFAAAPPEVVCLQGILDYYNPYTNWIARCFTIEYATWFRTVLPGLARLGFAVPLGGTTLFLRRHAIEALGGWDAHNVTEDADLGMRIARFGWRTELIPTVTQEEANCQPLAWVRQRSRWLKGYMVTWLVHMRTPLRLLHDVGLRQFLGIQLVFACTLSQFLLAPLIWLFWLGLIGLTPPFESALPPGTAALFLAFGMVNALISLRSISGQGRNALIPWVFAMVAYFPMATLAAYKALFELLFIPFYWDKTAHGKTHEGTSATAP